VFRHVAIAITILSALLSLHIGKAWPAPPINIDVRATILSSSNCKFRPPKSATVDFGILDPIGGGDVTVLSSLTIRCQGNDPLATFFITDDDGQYDTGPNANRMQHTVDPTQYIPYTLTLSPDTATIPKGVDQIIDITADLLGVDYQGAIAGIYTDTVTVTVNP
jgi:spore coat protein U-like protein